ncbi:LacI family DNA-binding transcriptional regulator [Paenibacillus oleatilyticus]|uniref:LacI family DNA-binding transcriptional regulator n=1 Tax=Paenibacillus oleatilyticus TaxID=2594886 RepID=UPI001C1F9574|nr:LacI family DNA-binding transcriptional regulator [Paenibacillus oleatilyticus]MBU7314393.1 LacI family transcriptional regulator [Paenibacillus oleatilyticus]
MSKKRQITIVDLAEAAGVSIATVSNVLNRRNVPMSAETIRKVEAAAELLGYRRNVMAASLSSKKSYELGMLVPSFGGYYGRFAEEMQRTAHQYGYHLSVFSAAGFDPEIEKRHLDVLLQRRVDGLFCHGLAMSQEATRQIVSDGTPLVLFNAWGWPSDIAAGAVNLDFLEGCDTIVRHLYEQGSRKMVYLAKAKSLGTDRQRRIGFRNGLDRLPESIPSAIVEMDDGLTMDEAVEQVLAFSEGVRPIGVMGFDDNVALAFMFAVLRHGYKVPQDVQIVGVNNDPFTSVCYPSMTTMNIPYDKQARLAIRLMLEQLGEIETMVRIDGNSDQVEITDAHEVRVPMQLVPRMSSQWV